MKEDHQLNSLAPYSESEPDEDTHVETIEDSNQEDNDQTNTDYEESEPTEEDKSQQTEITLQEEDEDKPFEYVDDLIHLSVFSLFFSPILGTVAIVKSCESKQYSFVQRYDSARRAAKTAKRLATSALVCGILFAAFITLVFRFKLLTSFYIPLKKYVFM